MAGISERQGLEAIRRNVEDTLRLSDDYQVGTDKRPHFTSSEPPPSNTLAPEASGNGRASDSSRHPKQGTDEPTSAAVAERIEKIGNASARAIMEACETTATDIEQTGQAAVDFAAEIMNEAKELAAGLRAKGSKMSEHLKEFALLAKKVSTTMRDTRQEVLSRPD
jgi:hypothetical protein